MSRIHPRLTSERLPAGATFRGKVAHRVRELMKSRMVLTVLTLLVAFTLSGAQHKQDEPRKISPRVAFDRELRGGETHTYRIRLKAGQFLHVQVKQQDIDVVVNLTGPDATKLVEVDSPNGIQGVEPLFWIAGTKGEYRVEVASLNEEEAAGRYEINVLDVRASTETDRKRVSAQQAFLEARSLRGQRGAEAREKRLEKYKEALQLWLELQEGERQLVTLDAITGIYLAVGDSQKSLEYSSQTLPLLRSLGDKKGEATSLHNIGNVYASMGEKDKALDFYTQALTLRRLVADRRGLAATLNQIGLVYTNFGEKQKALDFYKESLALSRVLEDHRSEAATLNNIGRVYADLGEKQKALDYYKQALPLAKSVNDRRGEAVMLGNIGSIHENLGDLKKALDFYNQALQIQKDEGDRRAEAITLGNIGSSYAILGENQKALGFFNQSLLLRRAVGDRGGEAITLNNIGNIYNSLGEKQKALEFYNQSLPLRKAVSDRKGEAITLNNIGYIHDGLGEKRKALIFYTQALTLLRAVSDPSGQATTLNNIGSAYDQLGQRQRALGFYNQALSLFKGSLDRIGEASTLNNIGNVYNSLNEKLKALDFYTQALSIRKAVGDRGGQSATLSSMGTIYYALGEKQKAADFYDQALALSSATGERDHDATIFHNLMYLWKESNSNLAIFYGKQSVNTYQQLRGNIKGLEKETQRSFLHSIESTYRTLADLMISQGRLPEAQTLLDLLKEEEFSHLVRRSSTGSSELLPYSAAEAEATKIIDQLATIGRQRSELLARKDRQALQLSETEQLNRLEEQINTANKELRRTLEALSDVATGARNRVAEVKEERSLMRDLRELGEGTVALYTVLAVEEPQQSGRVPISGEKIRTGWIILVTPDFRKAYPIDVADLEKTVFAFREVLRTDKYDPRPLAQRLYQMLFLQTSAQQKSTLAADLDAYMGKAKDKTLMWSLDGVLRYVPMAALHDGRRYLIEQYRNVVFNTASLGSLKDKSTKPWTALGLGVTESREEEGKKFPALPGAEHELYAVVHQEGKSGGVLPGAIKLNQDFNQQTMIEGLRVGYPVVHIASHFSFNAANPEQSFLLLGKNHLTVEALQDMSNPFEKVELLTLSACDTAMGSANGKEVEGFAYTAQSLGAKAVIASLWPVSDEGTDALMTSFYRLRRDNLQLPKGEAFRQSQLSLLRGVNQQDRHKPASASTPAGRADLAGMDGAKSDLQLFKPDPQKPFTHPYYWAPFILIGNWK